MSQKEDLSEVTVSQTLSSWDIDRDKGPNQSARRLLSILLVSVLLLFLIIASLVCAFWLLIYPKLPTETRGTGNKFAVHLLANIGQNKTVTWSATPGLGWNYLGSGFHFENQELQTTRDGMYYVYAKLRVYCSVRKHCNETSPAKLSINYYNENNMNLSILSMNVPVSQEDQQTAAISYSVSWRSHLLTARVGSRSSTLGRRGSRTPQSTAAPFRLLGFVDS
ncbi:uncharacterized protein LOC121271365 [Carcharodon carcharias]|uniref:uncharacterized protein LOC121271365 n=1 Tax=Carcharodon carcharias TaxID=13397 RepID=UPI001B7E12DA|nr:uncharacterized protein LOC121271365 [Carcharodon carcharias]